jgi:methyl-accepting chemotaxis protein
VAGVLAILPYRLYERDIRLAADHAHRMSAVVEAALVCPLREGTAADLVQRLRQSGQMDLALSRIEAGELQETVIAGRGSSVLDDTELHYVSAPIHGASGEPYVAQLRFDLSAMKRESLRLIADVVIAVTIGALAFSIAIFMLFRGALVQPLRELTRRVERIAGGESGVELPLAQGRELGELSAAIERLRRRSAP